jgi:predicted ribonuclease YlaK
MGVIVDEAQNLEEDQLILITTRVSFGCKLILSGDVV